MRACVQTLTGDGSARLILAVHRHLHKARGARHQRRCLGALKALLALLGSLVCTQHAFRHTVHILLQLLRVRWALPMPNWNNTLAVHALSNIRLSVALTL